MNKEWKYRVCGIDDALFIRGNVPMTKSEVRAVTLSKLKLEASSRVLDIGAGTGSVSVECGFLAKRVTAIEKNPEGVMLIQKNAQVFELDNIKVLEGSVPEAFIEESYDRVFIGGSGGKLEEIFAYLDKHVEKGGIIVANTITIENTSHILELLKQYGYGDIEAVTMNISRSKAIASLHMMIGENPITIISGKKT
jgi:cobalt-precorrin-6B (C15)-methyltransferase